MLISSPLTPSAKFLCAALFTYSLHAQAADIKRDPQGGITVSPAVAALIEQAEAGDADAANTLGFQYGNGLSVMQNDAESLKWYRKAAELGSVEAEYNLGFAYESGHGVKADMVEAAKWYRKAAEHGYAEAQNTLGILYENGSGVPRDYNEAAKWYAKAAEQGVAVAKENYARLIKGGLVKKPKN
ncbi:MAG TPA: tetratricopeptide repeat protein [Gammaproteobacteria bacterium]|nr:tetratricopeptide repeat protein [Gammaproteobacteria bacterium]